MKGIVGVRVRGLQMLQMMGCELWDGGAGGWGGRGYTHFAYARARVCVCVCGGGGGGGVRGGRLESDKCGSGEKAMLIAVVT